MPPLFYNVYHSTYTLLHQPLRVKNPRSTDFPQSLRNTSDIYRGLRSTVPLSCSSATRNVDKMGEIGSDRGTSNMNFEDGPRGEPDRRRGPGFDFPHGRGPYSDPRWGSGRYGPHSGRWNFSQTDAHHDHPSFGPRPGPHGDHPGPQGAFDGPHPYGPGRGDINGEFYGRFHGEGPKYRCHGPRFCWRNRPRTYIDVENEPKIDFLW